MRSRPGTLFREFTLAAVSAFALFALIGRIAGTESIEAAGPVAAGSIATTDQRPVADAPTPTAARSRELMGPTKPSVPAAPSQGPGSDAIVVETTVPASVAASSGDEGARAFGQRIDLNTGSEVVASIAQVTGADTGTVTLRVTPHSPPSAGLQLLVVEGGLQPVVLVLGDADVDVPVDGAGGLEELVYALVACGEPEIASASNGATVASAVPCRKTFLESAPSADQPAAAQTAPTPQQPDDSE